MLRVTWFMLIAVMYAMGLQGCATIVSGGEQSVTFNSEPDGATVVINGVSMGKTPVTIPLKRESKRTVVFTKDGYKPFSAEMTTTVNGWFFGNILTGGLLGSSTDSSSGAINEYSPDKYFVNLVPENSTLYSSDIRADAKMYIITNYKKIISELNTCKGEYLNTLFGRFNIESSKQNQVIEDLKKLSDEINDIPLFAEKAVDLLSKAK